MLEGKTCSLRRAFTGWPLRELEAQAIDVKGEAGCEVVHFQCYPWSLRHMIFSPSNYLDV